MSNRVNTLSMERQRERMATIKEEIRITREEVIKIIRTININRIVTRVVPTNNNRINLTITLSNISSIHNNNIRINNSISTTIISINISHSNSSIILNNSR